MREAAFNISTKLSESRYISEEEYEVNFVKNLERGSGRFKGKLPFKCFSCGRVGHYALDALIRKERCLKKVIEVIIVVIKVMTHPIVMKTLDFSWHMKIRT